MVLEAGRSPGLGWGAPSEEDRCREDREACPSPLEQQHAALFSFLKGARAPTLRSCQGVINLPCNDVITLMDTGLVEHFISTRALYMYLLPFTQHPVFLRHPHPFLKEHCPRF